MSSYGFICPECGEINKTRSVSKTITEGRNIWGKKDFESVRYHTTCSSCQSKIHVIHWDKNKYYVAMYKEIIVE